MNGKVRNLQQSDLEDVLTWRNSPEIRKHMLTQHEISIEEHQLWFNKNSKDESKRLLIVEDENIPIGFVQFSNVESGGIADWGFYLRPNAKPGSGIKLGVNSLHFAFRELHLHKVCGQALATNHKSIKFHLNLGFTQEGTLRQQCYIAKSYLDLVEFGLLRSEWEMIERDQTK